MSGLLSGALLLGSFTFGGCETGSVVLSNTQPKPARAAKGMEKVEQGQRYLERGLDDSALAAFNLALLENPRLTEAYIGIGGIHLKRDQLPRAESAYSSAAQIDPGSHDANYFLGLSRHLLGKIEQAIASYQAALKIQPDSFDANLNIASAYLQMNKADLALPHVQRATRLNPESSEAQANLAATYSLLGQYDKAVVAYREAMEFGDIPDPVVLGLADAHLNLGNFHLAANVLHTQVRRSPTALAYERLGYCQFKMAQYSSAIENYRQALALDKQDTSSLNGLGVCLMTRFLQTGGIEPEQKTEAIQSWRRSLQIQKNQPQIADLLSRYEKHWDGTRPRERRWNEK